MTRKEDAPMSIQMAVACPHYFYREWLAVDDPTSETIRFTSVVKDACGLDLPTDASPAPMFFEDLGSSAPCLLDFLLVGVDIGRFHRIEAFYLPIDFQDVRVVPARSVENADEAKLISSLRLREVVATARSRMHLLDSEAFRSSAERYGIDIDKDLLSALLVAYSEGLDASETANLPIFFSF